MQAYQYDEFEQPEWVLGRTGAVVQVMEIAIHWYAGTSY